MTAITGRALITGGSAGIGLSFAKELAVRGVDLVLVSRTRSKLEDVATDLRRHGVEVDVIAADLATDDGVETVIERLGQDPRIDIFINNAGSGLHEPTATTNIDAHIHGIDLMVRAPMRLAAAAALIMKERDSGIIINVGSVAGLIAMNNYSAIKSWMNTFSDALALEMVGTNVHVMTLLPGWVRTEFHERAGVNSGAIPSWLWLSSDRLVRDTLRAVEKGKNRVVPSKRFKVLALLASYFPRPGVVWATGKIKKGRNER